MYTNQEITDIYMRNHLLLYKICFLYMRNSDDAADILSETFCKMIEKSPQFKDTEHEKAWLIRVSTNLCKNHLKSKYRQHANIDDYVETLAQDTSTDDMSENVRISMENLPDKYKAVLVLYYYEGYSSEQIAKILRKPASTIRNDICKARKLLKEAMEDEG